MALYKRRRYARERPRPVSMYAGSISPVLLSLGSYSISPLSMSSVPTMTALANISNSTSASEESDSAFDTTLTSCATQSDNFEEYDLEIAELQHSPTCGGKKVWSFSTPTISPASSRRLGGLSGTPSPDITPTIASVDRVVLSESNRSSPTNSVSSTLQQLASRLRGTHSSSALENSGNERRYMVITEAIETERKYINSLEALLNVYLPALENVVAPRELRLLFPAQLEPLMERHCQLLTKLEERMSGSTPFPGIVGDIFARLLKESDSDFLDMYSAYMNEFKVAMTTLARYEQTSVEFREVLMLCQHSPSCEGLSLASYLLTPIQRLPRYELLLKELLKQTPMDHPDNFYVSDAIDLLHEELIRLNQSIKSCQLACSVRKATIRKPSFRVRTERAIAKLKRHVSVANMEDYSSGDSSTGHQEVRRSRMIRRRRGTLKPSPYRSEENLFVLEDEDGTPLRAKSMINVRPASSLIDLVGSYDGEGAAKHKPATLTPLASLPATPEPSPRPTSPSECSVNPVTDEETSRRISVYSTASSTSGIGSIENENSSQFDLRLESISCDPTHTSTPVRNRVSFRLENQQPAEGNHTMYIGGASVVTREHKKDLKVLKRRMSWSNAFKLLGRKKNYSAGKILDIGSPKNFRHIQHGFPTLPEGVEPSPCKSNTSSINTLNAVNL